jgi:hypothetical protein
MGFMEWTSFAEFDTFNILQRGQMVHFSEKRRGSRREKYMVVFLKGQCGRRNKYGLENNSSGCD